MSTEKTSRTSAFPISPQTEPIGVCNSLAITTFSGF